MRNFDKNPLKLDRSKNKLEDLLYDDLLYLVNHYSFTEITKLLKVSDSYLSRQLKLHCLKTTIDRRKKTNNLNKEEIEIQKYGKIGLTKREKTKITIEKIGKLQFLEKRNKKFKETWQKRSKDEEETRILNAKLTKYNKYGNYNNYEKIKDTNLKKYGVISKIITKEILEKTHSEEIINKMNIARAETWSSKSEEDKKAIYEKIKNTNLQKYGSPSHMQSLKWRESNTNVCNYFGSKEHLNNIENIIKKRRATMKTNGTTNTSHGFEDKLISFLRNTYPNYTIFQSYSIDDRYPFECDCYIKELDLFIEFQGSYFHNYRPFDESEEHLIEYDNMIRKGGQRKTIAIVWRYKDPLKRQTAKINNINYLEYWEDSQFNDIYDPIERWKRSKK